MAAAAGVLDSIHPVVRVVTLLLFALTVALGSPFQLCVAALLLFFFYLFSGLSLAVTVLPPLWRMRWFFLSIFAIYTWMTPGTPLLADAQPLRWWMPTVEGVVTGGQRLAALVLILLAVHGLLQITSRTQLVSSLYWLSLPLRFCGVARERFAIRVALVLATAGKMREQVAELVSGVSLSRRDLRGYASIAAALVAAALHQGETEPCHEIEIEVEDAPPLWQWSLPLLLVSGMWLLQRFV